MEGELEERGERANGIISGGNLDKNRAKPGPEQSGIQHQG